MPLVKRRFRVPCRGEECLKLYEYVKDRVPSLEHVEFKVSGSGLVVEAYGYETDVKRLWSELRSYVRALRHVSTRGLNSFRVDYIVKLTGKTFPPDVLVEVLSRQGHRVEAGEGVIYTSAGVDEVLGLVERISELNSVAKNIAKGTAARYFIVSASLLTGLPPQEIVERAVGLQLMEPDESGAYLLKHEWRRALDLLVRYLKQ